MDIQDGQTDGHLDNKCDTIIPCHYLVAGYRKHVDDKIKNETQTLCNTMYGCGPW